MRRAALVYTSKNTNRMKLGEFIKKVVYGTTYNLWKLAVAGNLTFEQDLVFSKIFSGKNIFNKIMAVEDNNVKNLGIPGIYALLRN